MWSIYRWSGGLGPHSLSLPFISSLSVFPRAKDVISESQWQWRCKAGVPAHCGKSQCRASKWVPSLSPRGQSCPGDISEASPTSSEDCFRPMFHPPIVA